MYLPGMGFPPEGKRTVSQPWRQIQEAVLVKHRQARGPGKRLLSDLQTQKEVKKEAGGTGRVNSGASPPGHPQGFRKDELCAQTPPGSGHKHAQTMAKPRRSQERSHWGGGHVGGHGDLT